jgi:hypothetical protein
LNLGGQIQQQTAEIERGEADPLRISGAESNADSCVTSIGSAAPEQAFRLRLSECRVATESNADSTSGVVSGTGAQQLAMRH